MRQQPWRSGWSKYSWCPRALQLRGGKSQRPRTCRRRHPGGEHHCRASPQHDRAKCVGSERIVSGRSAAAQHHSMVLRQCKYDKTCAKPFVKKITKSDLRALNRGYLSLAMPLSTPRKGKTMKSTRTTKTLRAIAAATGAVALLLAATGCSTAVGGTGCSAVCLRPSPVVNQGKRFLALDDQPAAQSRVKPLRYRPVPSRIGSLFKICRIM